MKTTFLMLILSAVLVGCVSTTTTTDYTNLDKPTATTGTIPQHHRNNSNIETQWERGNGKGVRVYLPTDSWDTGARRIYAWRLCEFDENGCLQKVNAQTIQTDAVSIEQLRPQSKGKR